MPHPTRDRADADPQRATFYAPSRLGPSQTLTPEGFLICEAVPIARTGQMHYAAGELPLEPGADGIITVERDAAEVFRPETMASFEGKPVTDDHPPVDVTPSNWSRFARGFVRNVRQGVGDHADLLLADLVITCADTIAAVRAGKREVSCGYDAEYEQAGSGRGRQTNIIGNHVALVEEGRCGPRCAIGDHKMPKSKRTVWDRLTTAFKAKDEAAFNEEIEAAQAEMESGETAPQRVVIEVKTPDADPEEKGEAAAAEAETKTGDDDPVATLGAQCEARFAAIEALLQKLVDGKAGATDEASEEEGEGAETKDEASEEDKAESETKDEAAEEDEDKGKTADAAGLAPLFRDTLARAEILAPGIKLPTYDAKADAKATKDTLCVFRRKVLDAAMKTDSGRAAITPFSDGRTQFADMTCDAARILFVAASERAKTETTGSILSSIRDSAAGGGTTAQARTPAQINAANRARWGRN
ncbi:DUF2213 domain-containing protein [Methylobacterium sp. CCH5-D2]|uniref:DUF2213 domain-containing protein n=1 Tax=Methylobacterium sp. CCH5-D2 TaxID=1768765 RepID=UPI0008343663|nr:DUF2213 domain-containing protein [Methylobacterium sp. CCH5-D2]